MQSLRRRSFNKDTHQQSGVGYVRWVWLESMEAGWVWFSSAVWIVSFHVCMYLMCTDGKGGEASRPGGEVLPERFKEQVDGKAFVRHEKHGSRSTPFIC